MSRSPRSFTLVVVLVWAALSPFSAAKAYDPRHIFITNRGANNILELDESLTVVRTLFAGDGLAAPNGMAFTPDGALWVADTSNDRILAFNIAGVQIGSIDTTTRLGPQVESIYFGADGTLYATSNPGLGTVARYTITRDALPDVVADAAFLNLGNVNLTNAGRILVSDFSGAMRGIREIDPATGAIIATFGTDLGRQEDVMVDGADRVRIALNSTASAHLPQSPFRLIDRRESL
jgi:DNA-binding beta-propeller fold protein YncE